jgi:uncharacterized protein (TIGR00251 family)
MIAREPPIPSAPAGPFASGRKGKSITARIRVKPGAAQERVRGIVETSEGPAIEISVTAPPTEGRANAAVIAALARDWRMPKSALSIVAGNKGRVKTILIEGEPGQTLPRLMEWLAALRLGKDV